MDLEALARLEAHEIDPVKTLPTSRKAGADYLSKTVSIAAIQAADASIMKFTAGAYQAPGAASNDPARDKGETWRGTKTTDSLKTSAVGPLGLWSK